MLRSVTEMCTEQLERLEGMRSAVAHSSPCFCRGKIQLLATLLENLPQHLIYKNSFLANYVAEAECICSC